MCSVFDCWFRLTFSKAPPPTLRVIVLQNTLYNFTADAFLLKQCHRKYERDFIYTWTSFIDEEGFSLSIVIKSKTFVEILS